MFQPFGKDYTSPYPLDAWFNDEFFVFEIPIVKGNVENVEILKEGDILRIKYSRPQPITDENRTYVTRSITQKDFNLAWKIPSTFDKDNISSTFENGLLSIFIPYAETQKPEKVQIIDVSNNWKKVAEGVPLENSL